MASSSIHDAHVTILDGLVSMNSLFAGLVFVGLAVTAPGQHSLENPGACDASITMVEKLLVYEVVSFCFFLLSTMVAQGLKVCICLFKSTNDEGRDSYVTKPVAVKCAMLGSALATVLGCIFLALSISTLAQIKVGILSCGSKPTAGIIATLSTMVPFALIFYLASVVYVFFQK